MRSVLFVIGFLLSIFSQSTLASEGPEALLAAALFKAIDEDQPQVIAGIMVRYPGTTENVLNEEGRTHLLQAIHTGRVGCALALLNGGANPNTPGRDGEVPFLLAASQFEVAGTIRRYDIFDERFLSVMSVMLERGVSINVQDQNGTTAAHRAACLGYVPVIQWLKARGADFSLTNKELNQRPIETAVFWNQVEVLRTLGIANVNEGLRLREFALKAKAFEVMATLDVMTGRTAQVVWKKKTLADFMAENDDAS